MRICRRPICRPPVFARSFNVRALLAVPLLLAFAGCDAPQAGSERFSVVETSILELQAAMERGELTSRQLVTEYLVRIGAL